jgi:hypothetical protein
MDRRSQYLPTAEHASEAAMHGLAMPYRIVSSGGLLTLGPASRERPSRNEHAVSQDCDRSRRLREGLQKRVGCIEGLFASGYRDEGGASSIPQSVSYQSLTAAGSGEVKI